MFLSDFMDYVAESTVRDANTLEQVRKAREEHKRLGSGKDE